MKIVDLKKKRRWEIQSPGVSLHQEFDLAPGIPPQWHLPPFLLKQQCYGPLLGGIRTEPGNHQKQVRGSPDSTHRDSKTCSHNATEGGKTGLSQPAGSSTHSGLAGAQKVHEDLRCSSKECSDQVAFEKKG